MGYNFGSDTIDYDALSEWIESRPGQVIACEGEFGDYLPFIPLKTGMGVAGKQSREVIWLNDEEELRRREERSAEIEQLTFSEGRSAGRSETIRAQ